MRTRHLLLSAAILASLTGCEPSASPLLLWEGSWQAAEPLFLDPAADSAYRAVQELRPGYELDEIRAIVAASSDVDYTSLEVTADTLTFLDGAETLCAGRYAAAGPDAGGTPGAAEHLTLVETIEGDCGPYQSASLGGLVPEGDDVHFHIVTGPASGPSMPPPWNPAVWSETMTPERFAAGLEAAAPNSANLLPER